MSPEIPKLPPRYDKAEEDWYAVLKNRSPVTIWNYLRTWHRIREHINMTLAEVKKLAENDPEALKTKMEQYKKKLRENGGKESYINYHDKVLKSYLTFAGVNYFVRTTRYDEMMTDPEVVRWHTNLARGSKTTADDRVRLLYRYLKYHNLTAKELVENAKRDLKAMESQLMDFVTRQEKEGLSPGYIENYIKAVKSWLRYNYVHLMGNIKVKNAGATPTLENEHTPTIDEVHMILNTANMRSRVIVALMAFSGVRPEVLGNRDASNGLRIRDLPELKIVGSTVTWDSSPARINIPTLLNKARFPYITFIGAEGQDYIKAYIETRIAEGETVTGDTPLIISEPNYTQLKKQQGFTVTGNISRCAKQAMGKMFNWRPYVFRCFFDTQMLQAESQGKMPHPYRVYMMGHKGDIDARYTTNKGQLPPHLIEDLRAKYKACEAYLSKMSSITVPEEKEMQDKEVKTRKEQKHKLVEQDDLVKYLDEGWELIRELANGKMLLRR